MATTQIKDGFNGGSDNQLKVNSDGSINVNTSGGGGSSNVNITEVGGNPVTTTLPTTNPSVGIDGAAAPGSSTQVGAQNAGGNLVPLSVDPSGRLLVDSTGTSVISGNVDASIDGLNAFQTSQYSVGTSAVQLTPTPMVNRSSMNIKVVCTGNNIVYIGNSSSVTTSTGFPLFNGDTLQIDLTPVQPLYAIGTAAGQTVYVLEIG
jgi:hypothetical protein